MAVTISVVIPVLQEQEQINGLVSDLRRIDSAVEIVVVDGDTSASTLSAIIDPCVIRLTAPKGRGNQLAAGTEHATGDILLMLHADTRLPDNAFRKIQEAVEQGADWGAFHLGIAAAGIPYRVIEHAVTLRSRLFTLPYGDQGIFVTRTALNTVGGVPAIPLMEDVALVRRLVGAGCHFRLLEARVETSARRWQQDGVLRRTMHNWWTFLRYRSGAKPEDLQRSYNRTFQRKTM